MRKPNWTVLYNIANNGSPYIGTAWEFFDHENQADDCLTRQRMNGNIPCKRPFHEATDRPHMGACHRY